MRKLVAVVLAATCVVLFSLTGKAQDVDINQGIELYNQAIKAHDGKQYDEAIKLGNDAYKIAVDAGEDGADLKATLETLIPKLYYVKANNLVVENKYDDAIKAFNEAKEIAEKYNSAEVKTGVSEDIPKLYLAMGKYKFDNNDFDGAVDALKQAAELDANNSQIYLIEGFSYIKKNDWDNAEVALNKVIELATAAGDEGTVKSATSPLSTVYLMKAQSAMSAKKWNEMLTYADKSLEAGESLNGYKMKAGAAAQLKRWDTVIAAYDKVIEMGTDKDKPAAYFSLGQAYHSKNNTAKACEYFKRLQNDPTYKAHAEQFINALQCK